MLKRIYTDPTFFILLAINIYCIIYYHQNPSGFATIVWLYWFQSVLIGIFNFADMITLKNYDMGDMKMNNEPVPNTAKGKGCVSFFFLCHFQFFHFVYAIFLLTQLKGHVDSRFVMLGVAAFSFNLILQFIQHKRMQRDHSVSIGKMMFLPYLRIVPMHLMILGPAFFNWHASDIFLILKTLADCLMFLIASPYGKLAKQPTSV